MDWPLSAGEGGTRRGCWEATEVGGKCGGRIFSAISCSLILLIRTRLSSWQGKEAEIRVAPVPSVFPPPPGLGGSVVSPGWAWWGEAARSRGC